MRRWVGWLSLTGFVACVLVSNYAVQHWGTAPTFPGGPHTVTIGPFTAPSAVLIVGISFSLRDLGQYLMGKTWVLVGIVVGAGLSYLVAPSLAFASMAGFTISELLDFGIYTPLADRGRWTWALVASNTAGSFIDSLVFLWIAFGWASLHTFLLDQWVLKTLMILPAVAVLAPWRIRRAVLARRTSPSLAE